MQRGVCRWHGRRGMMGTLRYGTLTLEGLESCSLGTVNDFHWGFKPVLSYSKPHTFSTSLGEEKRKKKCI